MNALALALTFVLPLAASAQAAPATWTIDFTAAPGSLHPVRPLHGVNGGPLCYRGTVDLRDRHRELGIPLTRLHDTVWVNAEAVDVHTVFRDFRNDPADPASYDFRATDDYLKAVRDTGAGVVFRLGESIEHTPTKYWVHPPADPSKWAEIATGIVRHYQAGWAGGLTNAVRYWEIWNEPDVRPAMWTGPDDQFLELFARTAVAIKTRFPDTRVGGPGFGGVGRFLDDRFQPSPFVLRFLAHCRTHRVPLDFFSWHIYTDNPDHLARLATAVRGLLDAEGFPATESHLNEWNYLPDQDWTPMLKEGQGPRRDAWYARMNGVEGAAFSAATLLRLQDLPVDAANYFTGEIQGFGLFSLTGEPKTTFHAFKTFQDLLRTPVRVPVGSPPAPDTPVQPTAVAGRDAAGTRATFLLAVHAPGTRAFPPIDSILRIRAVPWNGPTRWTMRRIDRTHPEGEVTTGELPNPNAGTHADLPFAMPAPGLVLVNLTPVPR